MAALRVACITSLLHRTNLASCFVTSSSSSLLTGRTASRAELYRPQRFCNTFSLRTFSMASSETPTRCCGKGTPPMTEESARALLKQVPDWDLQEENGHLQLERSWKAKNFVKGLEFMKCIAEVAESQGHHPDLHLVNWNDVKVNIWTHSVGGLTENDFKLAAEIDTLNATEFLRKRIKKDAPKPSSIAI